jgi:translation elongation factor EF-Ts
MTVDNELSQNAGMTKTINVYTYSGAAEEVAVGQGNTNRGSISYVGKDYTVKTVQQVLTDKIASIGENITIRRFVRFERGEGLQKREENFADEVMKQING